MNIYLFTGSNRKTPFIHKDFPKLSSSQMQCNCTITDTKFYIAKSDVAPSSPAWLNRHLLGIGIIASKMSNNKMTLHECAFFLITPCYVAVKLI